MFSAKETEYIKSQRLARIATVSPEEMQPDIVPVGFDFDGANFYISGRNLLNSTKYKNVMKNNKVSLSIDDLKPGESWEPRGIDRKSTRLNSSHTEIYTLSLHDALPI